MILFQSEAFKKTSKAVHRKYFWKNIKMTICLIVLALSIILALILIILFSTGVLPADSGSDNPPPATTTTTTAGP